MSSFHMQLTVAIVCLALVGCAPGELASVPGTSVVSATAPATTAEAATPTATRTIRPTNTPGPTRTLWPTFTALPPTPALPVWVLNDFLFGNAPPDCELPCWQDLRVNESSGEQVQNIFDAIFDLNGTIDFAMNNPDRGFAYETETAFGRSQSWLFSREPLETFGITPYLDRQTHILKALNFGWGFESNTYPRVEITAQRVIQELGAPSHMLVRVSLTERADQGNLGMLMFYDIGIAYGAELHIAILPEGDDYVAEFCLDNSRQNWTGGAILLMEPFPDDLADMEGLQSELLGNPYERSVAFEDMFNLTIEEMSELILRGQQACFYSKPLLGG